jgi:serine/threonine protein kinase
MADPLPQLTTALSDRYRIERELGAGGMATVYLALDLKHDRRVAIKVLRPELAAVIGAARFLREIKTIATLQHPHILGLIDSGEVNGTADRTRDRAGGTATAYLAHDLRHDRQVALKHGVGAYHSLDGLPDAPP